MKLLPLIPELASTLAGRFEALFWYVTITCSLAGLLVYAFIVFFCVKYRRGSDHRIDAANSRLDAARTRLDDHPDHYLLLVLRLGCSGLQPLRPPARRREEMWVIGKQWMWKAQYPRAGSGSSSAAIRAT